MNDILSGNVLWSYDYEVLERDALNDIAYQFSGIRPYHNHSGNIILTSEALLISGDIDLQLPLDAITQLYLGFDDVYTVALAKNFGFFWQPLRITLHNDTALYFIIDYNFFSANNKKWFDKLTSLLR